MPARRTSRDSNPSEAARESSRDPSETSRNPAAACGSSSQFENNFFTEMCSGPEAGSYLRLIDFVYHSTQGLRVIKKKKFKSGFESERGREGIVESPLRDDAEPRRRLQHPMLMRNG